MSKDLHTALKARGIVARPMDAYGLPDRIRFTMGSAGEMRRVLKSLDEIF